MALVDTGVGLSVSVARLASDAYVATIVGELDLHSAGRLDERLLQLADAPRTRLIADLCGVPFLDSTALGVLTRIAQRLRARGGELVLASDDPRLHRLLEITGLLAVFGLERSLAEAVERIVGDQAV